jgi:D-cysteine desulfhydrase family pyridoxal phosphate-dependent enzyme
MLAALPRTSLGFFPTPLQPLPNLSARLRGRGHGPALWVKRDDQTGLATGGNKTRKLEFLVADALQQNADTLITVGAPQSNHARQTAAAAAKAGLKSALVLRGTPPTDRTGNLLLDDLIGAETFWAGTRSLDEVAAEVAEKLSARGQRPYVIPLGGSNPIGAAGYAAAMLELVEQAGASDLHFDAIVFATSSGGTQSGLVLGAKLSGYTGRVVGISVDHHADHLVPLLVELAKATAQHIGEAIAFSANDFEVNDHYLGGGYAVMGEPECEAIRLCAQTEGLLVDPVYTGRALAGLIDLIRRGEFKAGQNVLFWHTGGTPALFAYAPQLISA